MTCKIEVELIGISHTGGDIGDDWTYNVQIAGQPGAPNLPINGQGWGEPGRRYAVSRKWTLWGDCGGPNTFAVTAQMNEEDFIWDDPGSASGVIVINCPGSAGIVLPSSGHQISGDVPENFGFLGTGVTNTVTFHFVASAICL